MPTASAPRPAPFFTHSSPRETKEKVLRPPRLHDTRIVPELSFHFPQPWLGLPTLYNPQILRLPGNLSGCDVHLFGALAALGPLANQS